MKVQYVSANIHIYKHIAFLGVYNSAAKKLSKFLRFRNVLLAACNLGARKKNMETHANIFSFHSMVFSPQSWKSGAAQSFMSGRFTACSFPSPVRCRAAV